MKICEMLFNTPHLSRLDKACMTVASYTMENEVEISRQGLPYVIFQGREHKLTRLLLGTLGDSDKINLDDVVHLLTAVPNYSDEPFDIIEGLDIVKAYQQGFAAASCMTGSERVAHTQFYLENPQSVRMLLFDTGDMQGRALLWNTTTGDLVVDRIYPNSGSHIAHYMLWAAKHNAWMRSTQGASFQHWEYIHAQLITPRHQVLVNWPQKDTFPWLDSFKFVLPQDIKGKILLSSQADSVFSSQVSSGVARRLAPVNPAVDPWHVVCPECSRETYVTRMRGNVCVDCLTLFVCDCCHCGETIDTRNDTYHWVYDDEQDSIRICHDCVDDYATSCQRCGGLYYDPEGSHHNEVEDEVWCGPCTRNSAAWCDSCDSYVLPGHYNHDYEMCDNCVDNLPDEEEGGDD